MPSVRWGHADAFLGAPGLTHYGQFWLEPYGYGSADNSLLEEMADTWSGLDGLYHSLHTVVRYRLNQAGLSSAKGKEPLPSHLLGRPRHNLANTRAHVLSSVPV